MTSRVIGVTEDMTERVGASDRIAHMAEDVRDACQRGERKVRDIFQQRYGATGWTADEDVEIGVVHRRVVVLLRYHRDD